MTILSCKLSVICYYQLIIKYAGVVAGVFYCGSTALTKPLKKLCQEFSLNSSTRFHFHKENFQFSYFTMAKLQQAHTLFIYLFFIYLKMFLFLLLVLYIQKRIGICTKQVKSLNQNFYEVHICARFTLQPCFLAFLLLLLLAFKLLSC